MQKPVTVFNRSAIAAIVLMCIAFWGTVQAYYKTITVTGYFSVALDSSNIWGGSSGFTNAGYSDSYIWRFNPTSGAFDKWSLLQKVNMKGAVARIIPLPTRILLLISGTAGAQWRTGGAPDSTYNCAPNRDVDGGIVSIDRASGAWTIENIPVYDVEGYQLIGNILWLACGDRDNPRKIHAYRYNLSTLQLDLIAGMSDCHCVAIDSVNGYGYVGTHHGRTLEYFSLSNMAYVGNIDKMTPPANIGAVTVLRNEPPQATAFGNLYLSLIKAMLITDNQLWAVEPMGGSGTGGIGMLELPSRACTFAHPVMWQYVDFGDETSMDLQRDPVDNNIIWACDAKGLFKVNRTPTPPTLDAISMDGLPDHNLQRISVDANAVYAGTELGYLAIYSKSANTWSVCGTWQDGLVKPVAVTARQAPGAVTGLTGNASGASVTLSWSAPSGAESYYVRRDSVLIGYTGTTTFTDNNVTSGNHVYAVAGCQRAFSKGGALGPFTAISVSAAAGATAPGILTAKPDTILWGLGTMVYVDTFNLYVDKYEFPNVKGVYPLGCVTWTEAKQLAAWQGKRLETQQEYIKLAGGPNGMGWCQASTGGSNNCTQWYGHLNEFKVSGGPPVNAPLWGLYDFPCNLQEWTGDWSPLGDGHTYGLAAGGSWPQVSIGGVSAYAPIAEYPVGSWARNPDVYNHSEIGFRCVLNGDTALKYLNGDITVGIQQPAFRTMPRIGQQNPPLLPVRLYSLAGKLVNGNVGPHIIERSGSGFSSGVYFVKQGNQVGRRVGLIK